MVVGHRLMVMDQRLMVSVAISLVVLECVVVSYWSSCSCWVLHGSCSTVSNHIVSCRIAMVNGIRLVVV